MPLKYKIRKQFKCPSCPNVFALEKHLKLHRKVNRIRHIEPDIGLPVKKGDSSQNGEMNNGSNSETRNKTDSTKDILCCIVCKQKFASEMDLNQHFPKCGLPSNKAPVKRKTAPQSTVSGNPKNIDTGKTIKKPKTVHSDENSISKEHVCLVCKKLFMSADTLKLHNEICKIYLCDQYGNSWTLQKQYENHLRSCQKTFACDMCVHKFNRKNSLLRHQRNHYPKNDTYKCPICLVIFENDKELSKHTTEQHVRPKWWDKIHVACT